MRLNADVGEIKARVDAGEDDALIAVLDDANVACGGHAGDDNTIDASVRSCLQHGVRLGAHPSFPDRENFGRTAMTLSSSALAATTREQLRRLQTIANARGARVEFVKPHGALYHAVGADLDVALAFVGACVDVVGDVPIVLFWQAPVRAALARRGVVVVKEGFADRGLDDKGFLLPRTAPGALLGPDDAVAQVRRFGDDLADVDTVCVHGDGKDALAVATRVSAALRART